MIEKEQDDENPKFKHIITAYRGCDLAVFFLSQTLPLLCYSSDYQSFKGLSKLTSFIYFLFYYLYVDFS